MIKVRSTKKKTRSDRRQGSVSSEHSEAGQSHEGEESVPLEKVRGKTPTVYHRVSALLRLVEPVTNSEFCGSVCVSFNPQTP